MKLNSLFAITAATSLIVGFTACDVDKTQEGELPSVDVDVEGGQLPKYDVDGPDITVDTKKVEVPVPDIDVELPKDDDNE